MAVKHKLSLSSFNREWQYLQALSGLLLCCTSQEASNRDSDTINIPKATEMIQQTTIGSIPDNVKLSNSCILLNLCTGHPVIAFVLYHNAGKKRSVYFIQTSKLPYNQHKKKVGNLDDSLGKITIPTRSPVILSAHTRYPGFQA